MQKRSFRDIRRGYRESIGDIVSSHRERSASTIALEPTRAATGWAASFLGCKPEEVSPSISTFIGQITDPLIDEVLQPHLDKEGIEPTEFMLFMLDTARGMQKAHQKFGHVVPPISITTGRSIHFSPANDDSKPGKIAYGLAKVAHIIKANKKKEAIGTIHATPDLDIVERAHFIGFEESTHAYEHQLQIEERLHVHNSSAVKRLGMTNFDYYHTCPHEVFAGFHIREEMRCTDDKRLEQTHYRD